MTYSQYFLIVFLVSNSIVYLVAEIYTAKPGRNEPLKAALKRSFELRCVHNGVDDGEFDEWFRVVGREEVSVKDEKPGHYVVRQDKHESNLTIKIFVDADSKVEKWFVKTKGGQKACEFGSIALIPSPQSITDDKGVVMDVAHESVRRSEDQLLSLTCAIEPSTPGDVNRIQWEYSVDGKEYGPLPGGINKSGPKIDTDSVKKDYRGFYRCKINDVSFTVLLRVKDKLAALWPFIGIVSIVLILVIIILIFEKRQKSNKKTVSTDEDDQDHASDPLVRTTTKVSDNDNKKRAVKA